MAQPTRRDHGISCEIFPSAIFLLQSGYSYLNPSPDVYSTKIHAGVLHRNSGSKYSRDLYNGKAEHLFFSLAILISTIIQREGKEGFFIKFGDGSPVGRYKTCNPSFKYVRVDLDLIYSKIKPLTHNSVAINSHQLNRKLPNLLLRKHLEYEKEGKESKPSEVFAGKFLEQKYFQPASYEDSKSH